MSIIPEIEKYVVEIKTIVSSANKIEKSFQSLLLLHETINTTLDKYISNKASNIQQIIVQHLQDDITTYRTNYRKDLNESLNNLNTQFNITSTSSFNVGSLSKDIKKELLKNIPELFEDSIYYDLLNCIDLSIKKEDLETKEVKKMINNYQETRDDIITELDNFIDDVKEFENNVGNIQNKILPKAKKTLHKLYACHLNYLNAVKHKKESDFKISINGEIITGKQSTLFNKYLNN